MYRQARIPRWLGEAARPPTLRSTRRCKIRPWVDHEVWNTGASSALSSLYSGSSGSHGVNMQRQMSKHSTRTRLQCCCRRRSAITASPSPQLPGSRQFRPQATRAHSPNSAGLCPERPRRTELRAPRRKRERERERERGGEYPEPMGPPVGACLACEGSDKHACQSLGAPTWADTCHGRVLSSPEFIGQAVG